MSHFWRFTFSIFAELLSVVFCATLVKDTRDMAISAIPKNFFFIVDTIFLCYIFRSFAYYDKNNNPELNVAYVFNFDLTLCGSNL